MLFHIDLSVLQQLIVNHQTEQNITDFHSYFLPEVFVLVILRYPVATWFALNVSGSDNPIHKTASTNATDFKFTTDDARVNEFTPYLQVRVR